MSRYLKCKMCRGTGYKWGTSRAVICTKCGGKGRVGDHNRGHHEEVFGPTNQGTADICPLGHIKEGVTIGRNAKLIPYCLICHRQVMADQRQKKKRIAMAIEPPSLPDPRLPLDGQRRSYDAPEEPSDGPGDTEGAPSMPEPPLPLDAQERAPRASVRKTITKSREAIEAMKLMMEKVN